MKVAAYDYATNSRFYQNAQKLVQEMSGSSYEDLIGEEMVTDSASASALADRCMEEAHRLFDSTANWNLWT